MSPEPRVGVGAMILDAEGRLLLVQRRRDPEAGFWGLPGGKVDFGERVADACVREIREELGVGIVLGDLICIVDQIDRDAGTHWVAPTFLARIIDGAASNREPDAHAAIGWFALDNLPSPLTLSTRHSLAARGQADGG